MKDRINNITGILYYGLKCRYFISRSGMVFKCEDNVKGILRTGYIDVV